MKTLKRAVPFSTALVIVLAACGGGGNGGNSTTPTPPPQERRAFRAIGGISMGAFGAMNLGTKHSDEFGTILALGGPIDLEELLRHTGTMLQVKPQAAIPAVFGDEATFDHQLPYPGRDQQLSLLQDLIITLGNPFLHHPDPNRQYLASDSEPAQIRRDDMFGTFTVPANPRGFLDGGDANGDGVRQTGEAPATPTDVLLLAGGSLESIAPGAQGVDVGERMLADLNGDGVYDVGDGIVANFSEPFTDMNGNSSYDAGEPFSDVGLDGVAGTGDFGEGNGRFDEDPDRANWIAEDPLSRLRARSASDIQTQRIYMDVGSKDEFGFSTHYDHMVALLQQKGLAVDEKDGFSANCTKVPQPKAQFLLIRYDGGHVGIPDVDSISNDLLDGDFCGPLTLWQRLITVIGYANQSFPNGDFGLDGIDPRGDTVDTMLPSPALAAGPGATAPMRRVLVYRPPAYHNTSNRSFPIVYFLGGYGQEPEDYQRMGDLLDLLIAANQVQNMYFAFLPGAGGRKGSFYANHQIPESQVPGLANPTSGRYEDSIFEDLIPQIETSILNGRVRGS